MTNIADSQEIDPIVESIVKLMFRIKDLDDIILENTKLIKQLRQIIGTEREKNKGYTTTIENLKAELEAAYESRNLMQEQAELAYKPVKKCTPSFGDRICDLDAGHSYQHHWVEVEQVRCVVVKSRKPREQEMNEKKMDC